MAKNSQDTFISHDSMLTLLDAGAARPTTIGDALTGEELGWLHEDGETFSVSKTINNLRAHQGNTIVRTSISDNEITFAVTALEDSALVRSLYWGKTEVAGVISTSGAEVIEGTFVYDTMDTQNGYEKARRYVFEGTVTPNGDLTNTYSDITGYPLLITVKGNVDIISDDDAS